MISSLNFIGSQIQPFPRLQRPINKRKTYQSHYCVYFFLGDIDGVSGCQGESVEF